jgi:TrmH RNA methyltransferase
MAAPKKTTDIRICGVEAILATFAKRPKSLGFLAFSKENSRNLGEVCSFIAQEKKSYKLCEEQELNEIAGHRLHGGAIAVVTRPPTKKPSYADFTEWQKQGEPLLILDGFDSGATLGRLIHTAHALRINKVLFSETSMNTLFTDEAWLHSGGALEKVMRGEAGVIAPLCKQLRDKFLFIAGVPTGIGGRNIDFSKPINAPGRPIALVLSDQIKGPSDQTLNHCEYKVQIPGLGKNGVELKADALGAILLAWLQSKKLS